MDMLEIEVEEVLSPLLKEENWNEFINKQLLSRMFDSLEGGDFEKNLLFSLGEKNPYTRVKTAGKGRITAEGEEYTKKIFENFDRETIRKLLYICRFCSYVGGPGFPDLIVFGHGFELVFASEELLPENILFVLLAQQLGIRNIKIMVAVPQGRKSGKRSLKIDLKTFLDRLLTSRRFSHYGDGLERLIAKEKERLLNLMSEKEIQQSRDETRYLENQKQKMPFALFTKWHEHGINANDVSSHLNWLEQVSSEEEREKEQLLVELGKDELFQSLGKGMDEESIKKRIAHIKNRFDIGNSRAEELVKSAGR